MDYYFLENRLRLCNCFPNNIFHPSINDPPAGKPADQQPVDSNQQKNSKKDLHNDGVEHGVIMKPPNHESIRGHFRYEAQLCIHQLLGPPHCRHLQPDA